MMGYASRTGTRRNLDELRAHGWRLMVSATGAHRTEGFQYCIDNGAWTSYQKGDLEDLQNVLIAVAKTGDVQALRLAHWPRLRRWTRLLF